MKCICQRNPGIPNRVVSGVYKSRSSVFDVAKFYMCNQIVCLVRLIIRLRKISADLKIEKLLPYQAVL